MVIDTVAANNSVRGLAAGDTGVTIVWGIASRPYPVQQTTTANTVGGVGFGASAPPPGPIDTLRFGYISVQMNALAGPVTKGGAVFVWVAATTTGHVQGQFESAGHGWQHCHAGRESLHLQRASRTPTVSPN